MAAGIIYLDISFIKKQLLTIREPLRRSHYYEARFPFNRNRGPPVRVPRNVRLDGSGPARTCRGKGLFDSRLSKRAHHGVSLRVRMEVVLAEFLAQHPG